ncbi:MAG TPA: NTP transferase domain-containing protein, partial [Sulfurovum sp.]|uniref:NTP transferase domain-containing protein n=1 Tax=Sulfurovum sp. TaxID=1969726 RepID=UPI002F95163E
FGPYRSLAEFQYHRLSSLFETVYISAKKHKFDFSCRVIEDIHQESSPFAAIISVFETLDAEEVFLLSVDAPFVNKETIERILNANDSTLDAIVAESPSGVQPLCGLYKRSILPLAYAQLKKNNHKLKELLALANTRFVKFDEDFPFMNLNHPEEYQEALKHL